jgi:hypothetical protein
LLYIFVLIFKKNFKLSHIPERKEKDCLNCGTIVQGRFCQHCGQENVVPHETFWHMFTHFFYDITHFDTNFFSTVHHLILKPGFLSTEYIKGRRSRYLHPIRMYVFTSAIFFLLFFTFFEPQMGGELDTDGIATRAQRLQFRQVLQNDLLKDSSNAEAKRYMTAVNDTNHVLLLEDIIKYNGNSFIKLGRNYNSFHEYDSIQGLLPPSERDGWIMRRLTKKIIEINSEYMKDPKGTTKRLTNGLLHRLPYMLFISLPLFAMLLKLIYIRRKQFFYADHGIFTIHLYIFTFILLLVTFSVGALQEATGWQDLDWVIFLLFLLLFFYLYKAMRNFYGQRRGKTFLKFLLVSLLSIVMMFILFIIFIFFSAVTF